MVETTFYGKNLCNLLVNEIINEYNKIDYNHSTNIKLTNLNQFIIVNGFTSISGPINYSELFRKYIKSKLNTVSNFNVIDLIEYNKPYVNKFIHIDLHLDESLIINRQIIDSSKLQGNYIVDEINNIIIHNNNNLYKELNYEGFNSFFIDKPFSFCSDNFFGKSLLSDKLLITYMKYIFYNLYEKQLLKDINFNLFFNESDINLMSFENINFRISSKTPFVKVSWIESLILDLFDFTPSYIIEHLSLREYNFENEILNNNRCWLKRDRTKDMILF